MCVSSLRLVLHSKSEARLSFHLDRQPNLEVLLQYHVLCCFIMLVDPALASRGAVASTSGTWPDAAPSLFRVRVLETGRYRPGWGKLNLWVQVAEQRCQKCIRGVLDLPLDAISSHRQEWQHRKGFCNDTPIVLVAAKMCFWLAETEEVALAAVLAMVALGKWSSGALPEADNRLYYTVLCHLLCCIIP